MKDWFVEQAHRFLSERNQLRLPGLATYPEHTPSVMLAAEEAIPYKTTSDENE